MTEVRPPAKTPELPEAALQCCDASVAEFSGLLFILYAASEPAKSNAEHEAKRTTFLVTMLKSLFIDAVYISAKNGRAGRPSLHCTG
jgi:hypothetical protein